MDKNELIERCYALFSKTSNAPKGAALREWVTNWVDQYVPDLNCSPYQLVANSGIAGWRQVERSAATTQFQV